jgi:hypothetical protein
MKWLSLRIGGQRWAVHLVRGGSAHFEADEDETVAGITYADRCRIYVSKDLDEQARDETLLHELLHAAFAVSGAWHALSETVGPEASSAVEERLVRALTPVLHRLLVDLGFKFPKGPFE